MMTSLPAQGIAARLPEDALLAIFAHLPAETLAVARQVRDLEEAIAAGVFY